MYESIEIFQIVEVFYERVISKYFLFCVFFDPEHCSISGTLFHFWWLYRSQSEINDTHRKSITSISVPLEFSRSQRLSPQRSVKELFNKIGGYDKDFFRGGADWDFWLNIADSDYKGKRINQIIYERRYRQNNVGSSWIKKRPENAMKIINKHPQFFKDQDRRNLCLGKSYELAAREYKRIGNRSKASFLAEKAIEFGNHKQNLDNIIHEGKMSFWRYNLRRLGRLL